MKVFTLVITILLLTVISAFAQYLPAWSRDLSDYPDLFIKDDILNVTLVVGDGASASNVLAQAAVSASLSAVGGRVYNKLASEVEDLNRNIISFGNPCINEITNSIMYNPNPCDKNFKNGQAYISLYKNDDFVHIVVAGYSDAGTRKAAEFLADYENNLAKGTLAGNIVILNVPEEKPATVVKPIEAAVEEEKPEEPNMSLDIEAEKQRIIDIINKKIANKTEEPEQKMEIITQNITSPIQNGDMPIEKTIQSPKEKEIGIFKKIIDWILLLFK